jgi:hypothetical protein
VIEAEDKRRGDGTGIGPTFVRLAWHASGTYSKVEYVHNPLSPHHQLSPLQVRQKPPLTSCHSVLSIEHCRPCSDGPPLSPVCL